MQLNDQMLVTRKIQGEYGVIGGRVIAINDDKSVLVGMTNGLAHRFIKDHATDRWVGYFTHNGPLIDTNITAVQITPTQANELRNVGEVSKEQLQGLLRLVEADWGFKYSNHEGTEALKALRQIIGGKAHPNIGDR